MNVLLTGGCGAVGSAITDHLADREEYEFTVLDLEEHPEYESYVANVADFGAIRPAFDGVDAVIHLAVYPPGLYDEHWEQIFEVNIGGTYNTLEAARQTGVERVIFASSNHVAGMYERENAPDIYDGTDVHLDGTTPVRPDSLYGVSKLFGEDLGRYFVEERGTPQRFYAVRICSLRDEEWDHPYGDAERRVEAGEFERGSDEYDEWVARLKAMWLSRRDCAHLLDRMLQDDTVTFDIFYGLSDNERRWHDIDHAKDVLGYTPQDNAEEWDAPPE